MRNSNYLTTNLVKFRSTINKQRRMKLYQYLFKNYH